MKEDNKRLYVTTLAGLEPLLGKELEELGMEDVEVSTRGAYFTTDYRGMVRVNLASRYGIRVLIPWFKGKANSTDELYKLGLQQPWEKILGTRSTMAIDAVVNSDHFQHSHFTALRLKDAIADRFRRKTGKRPSVKLENPDIRIHLRVSGDSVTISLDSSGDSLHRRGYRPKGAMAPLNECLAAGMLAYSGWKPNEPLYVPMCGSGTLVMEAAMMAANLPSQWFRLNYGFLNWNNLDQQIVEEERLKLWQNRSKEKVRIVASDIDYKAVKQTNEALSKIAWPHDISVEEHDFMKHQPPGEPGVVVLNPPYGERLQPDDIHRFYGEIGSKLKHDFTGCRAWVISSNLEAYHHIGFKPYEKHKLFNGRLECVYAGFELYEGSKKKQKASTAE